MKILSSKKTSSLQDKCPSPFKQNKTKQTQKNQKPTPKSHQKNPHQNKKKAEMQNNFIK